MEFTNEEEPENKINILDITIAKEETNIKFAVHRKPTATDIVIPNGSCHPPGHKLAAIRHLNNGILKYPIKDSEKRK
jgi:hypothetical protein